MVSKCFKQVIITVAGRNPKQPPGMYKTLQSTGDLPYQLIQLVIAGFLNHQP